MKKTVKILIIFLTIIAIICLILILINKSNISKNNAYVDESIKPEERYTQVKQKYECNEFSFVNVNTEDLILIYFNKYKNNMANNIQEAYDSLDEEYRKKRFGNINEYRKYVNDNYSKLMLATLSNYKIDTTKSEYTQYICTDNLGNYYIFRETAIMQYKLILDTYTLDLPEFTEKYNSANENQKVALNIDKFMSAISSKDYKYAYNCLAGSFKNNYFKTQLEFENYAKANFYENNTVTYNNFEKQGDLCIYSVTITDTKTNNKKQKTFIMQLGEGTEFVMSFDVGR